MLIASRAQMKKIDEILLEKYTIEELVDKAAECVLEEILDKDHICVVCGRGNNGADGYALALKLLKMKKHVSVISCKHDHLSQACNYYYQLCLEKGLLVEEKDEAFKKCDLLIDAMFGFGCHSNPLGIEGEMIQKMNDSSIPIVSIDVPSGMDCDSGKCFKNCIHATKTITFFAYKLGFFHPDAMKHTGEVVIKRLKVEDFSNQICLCESLDQISFQKKSYDGHKYTYGRSFLICGSEQYQGAALLSTKASVYTGCGLTCLCSDPRVLQAASLAVPEAIHASFEQVAKMSGYQAALIGCGLDGGEELLRYVLHHTQMPLVIDASALNVLASHLDWLDGQRSIIITPHLGEFKRLCPELDDPTMSAIEFAKKYHIIVVLKGPHTLITDGHQSYRCMSGNGAMATGGSGDVLSGIIVSLLAQGYDPLQSACKGVYLHGAIGDQLAQKMHTVLPSKIIEEIPFMMKKFENV